MHKTGFSLFSRFLHKRGRNAHNSIAGVTGKFSNGGTPMTAKNDKRRENEERKLRSNPNERKHADSNRDGDSARNRSDDDLFGTDEY